MTWKPNFDLQKTNFWQFCHSKTKILTFKNPNFDKFWHILKQKKTNFWQFWHSKSKILTNFNLDTKLWQENQILTFIKPNFDKFWPSKTLILTNFEKITNFWQFWHSKTKILTFKNPNFDKFWTKKKPIFDNFDIEKPKFWLTLTWTPNFDLKPQIVTWKANIFKRMWPLKRQMLAKNWLFCNKSKNLHRLFRWGSSNCYSMCNSWVITDYWVDPTTWSNNGPCNQLSHEYLSVVDLHLSLINEFRSIESKTF